LSPLSIDLAGRTAVVCGASAGIGRGIAESLAEAGADLVLFDNDEAGLAETTGALGGVAVCGDLRVPADLERLAARAREAFGGVDVLVNNGGGPGDGTAAAVTPERLAAGMELLLTPFVRLVQLLLPDLARVPGRGRIITVVSDTVRQPTPGLILSNVFRPAVMGWLKTLALELGPHGVTVNGIAPGFIETPSFAAYYAARSPEEDLARIPLGRFGSPRDVGDVAAFLASDRGGYVHGSIVTVDGGENRFISG
jgi:3-oxoacyl-[acyl-carrier protein] reductase